MTTLPHNKYSHILEMIELITNGLITSIKSTAMAMWKGMLGVLTGLGLLEYGNLLFLQITPHGVQEWVVAVFAILTAGAGFAYTAYKLYDFIQVRKREALQDETKHQIAVIKELNSENLIDEDDAKLIIHKLMVETYGENYNKE